MTPLASSDLGVSATSLAADVRLHLTRTPRELPSRALYDSLGSALFDAICLLPWYPVTRAERRLIARYRLDIFTAAGSPRRLVELGCGNGEKLDLLLGPGATGVERVDLVDVSASALAQASRLLHESRKVDVVTHEQRYEVGLARATASRRPGERLCVLFLGSNIGNFDPPGADTFLATIRARLSQGDRLLIGADLVKPERELLLAYDDPLGVTAAFNKNLLVHLNRELGATLDVSSFAHRAVWNAPASRIEMHLVSERHQRVDIPVSALSMELNPGEVIWTESSYKHEVGSFQAVLQRAGFSPVQHWVDEEGQFALFLVGVE